MGGGSRKKGRDVGRTCVSVGEEGCYHSHIKVIPYLKILPGSLTDQSLMIVSWNVGDPELKCLGISFKAHDKLRT